MLLPRTAFLAALAVRQQVGSLLPATYCSPYCPSCRTDVADFNKSVSCVANSDFLTNCGACQQCVITYNLEGGLTQTNAETVLSILSEVLDLCSNSSVSSVISALQSQASRLSLVGATATPTSGNLTMAASSSNTSIPTFTPASAAPSSTPDAVPQPLSLTWIVGPIIGSFLGLATVVVVIFCTKRKQRREVEAIGQELEMDKKVTDEDDSWKPQLHSEDLKPMELETREVFELAAPEPVGSELSTPKGNKEPINDWPLPISPLPALFVSAELRDQRIGGNESPMHETYYNP